MSIYTRRGDKGNTDLFSGERVKKYDDQVEAYGVIDEVNSYLGLVRAKSKYEDICEVVYKIQQKMFVVAAELASRKEKPEQKITLQDINYLEEQIDSFSEEVIIEKKFVVPGESEVGSFLDITRTIIRRAERRVIKVAEKEEYDLNQYLLQYINRLSDLTFMLARVEDSRYVVEMITDRIVNKLLVEEG